MGDEFVVELLAVEIGISHLDAHSVSEREASASLTTNEAEALVVETEAFFANGMHGDEAFAVVVVHLRIYAVFGHSTDMSVVLFPYLVRHELHLLVLDAGSLRRCSQLLHGRTMLT